MGERGPDAASWTAALLADDAIRAAHPDPVHAAHRWRPEHGPYPPEPAHAPGPHSIFGPMDPVTGRAIDPASGRQAQPQAEAL
jgi:hypothetical protein